MNSDPHGSSADSNRELTPRLPGAGGPQRSAEALRGPAMDLMEGDVHVWSAPLDLPESLLPILRSSLCRDELERAARFRFERHRDRFIAGRGLLRLLLSAYLQVEPGRLEFSYGPNGKPALAGAVDQALHFNLAHSEDLALLAITRVGPVGVDIERVRTLEEAEDLVIRFFSAAEAKRFAELPPAQKPAAFFNLWTRKEAWLKATGEGIAHSLHRVEVSFVPGVAARLVCLPEDLGNSGEWCLRALTPAPEFVGALAVRGSDPKLTERRWEIPDLNRPLIERRISI